MNSVRLFCVVVSVNARARAYCFYRSRPGVVRIALHNSHFMRRVIYGSRASEREQGCYRFGKSRLEILSTRIDKRDGARRRDRRRILHFFCLLGRFRDRETCGRNCQVRAIEHDVQCVPAGLVRFVCEQCREVPRESRLPRGKFAAPVEMTSLTWSDHIPHSAQCVRVCNCLYTKIARIQRCLGVRLVRFGSLDLRRAGCVPGGFCAGYICIRDLEYIGLATK